jgi:hypothetical protein
MTLGKNFLDVLYLAIWPTKRWMVTVLTIMSLKAASEEGAVFCGVGGLYEMHNRGWIYLLWGEY